MKRNTEYLEIHTYLLKTKKSNNTGRTCGLEHDWPHEILIAIKRW